MNVSFRQKVVVAVLRPLAWAFARLLFGYKAERWNARHGPCLIVSNHVSKLDPLFLSLSFSFPVYFVAAEGVFKKPFWSSLLVWLMSPIPKLKGMSDLSTVREMVSAVRQGGSVGLFPNGNTSYSGDEQHIVQGLSRLVKLLKVPLVIYNLHGLYGVDPRWSAQLRRGPSSGRVRRVLSVKECSALSNAELDEVIKEGLSVSAVRDRPLGALYRSKRKAEYLERVFFICPDCQAIDSFRSEANRVHCRKCGYELEYRNDLSFRLVKGRSPMHDVKSFYDFQVAFMGSLGMADIEALLPIVTDGEIWGEEHRGRPDRILATGLRVELNRTFLTLKGQSVDEEIPFNEIEGFALHLRNRLLFFFRGRYCWLKGDPRRNALKFPYFFYTIKRLKGENPNGFLGI